MSAEERLKGKDYVTSGVGFTEEASSMVCSVYCLLTPDTSLPK